MTVPLTVALLSSAVLGQTAVPQQNIQDQYQNKIFLLRGLFSGDFLHYDSTGVPMGSPIAGDWTLDGFVLVSDIQISGQRLEIKGRRLQISVLGRGFQFQANTPKKQRKAPSIKIEAELGSGSPREAVDALVARIFLTNRDTLSSFVPDYWEPCVSAALRNSNDGKYAACRFSPELLTVPGVVPAANPEPQRDADSGMSGDVSNIRIYRAGKGISPPRPVSTPDPQFTDAAHRASLQGVVTLGLIVDSHGIPRNVHILSPLGCGLDAQAVRTVSTWRFKPAEQEGHEPVAVEIAVEVDFHLY